MAFFVGSDHLKLMQMAALLRNAVLPLHIGHRALSFDGLTVRPNGEMLPLLASPAWSNVLVVDVGR
jgi:hypothetical protein